MPRVDDAYQRLVEKDRSSQRCQLTETLISLQPLHNSEARASCDSLEPGFKVERHEKVTVNKKIAMWLNGENERQMAHAEAVKQAGGVSLDPKHASNSSVDQHWEVDFSKGALRADRYVQFTTCLWLGVKIPVLALFMLLAMVPPMVIAGMYTSRTEEQTERFHRSCFFYIVFSLCLVTGIPAILLITLSLILDYTVYYMFSLTFCLVTCRWRRAFESQKKIRPYSNGPGVLLHLPDFFVCVLGQCTRKTMGETWYMISTMWILIPWLKYYVCCNPWIYDLDHRLCQKISTDLSDLGAPEDVANTCRDLISRAKQPSDLAKRIESWSFVPHYPYPPPMKRWALGLQAGGQYHRKFTLLCHTTHAISDAGDSTEQLVISNSCKHPIYRVMLWYSNPFHFLTGWAEASVSTKTPNASKDNGGEHPMWLVSGKTPLTSGRASWTGSGIIDGFFDYWFPVFVHEMRREVYSARFADRSDGDSLALHYANSKHQEDDILRERPVKKEAFSPISQAFSPITPVRSKQEAKETYKKLNRVQGAVADTNLGKMFANVQQGSKAVELTTIITFSPSKDLPSPPKELPCALPPLNLSHQEPPQQLPSRITSKSNSGSSCCSQELPHRVNPSKSNSGSSCCSQELPHRISHATSNSSSSCCRLEVLRDRGAERFLQTSRDGHFQAIVECRRRVGILKEQCAQRFVEASQHSRFSSIVECRRRAGILKEQCAQRFVETSQDGRFSSTVECRRRAGILKEQCAQRFVETFQDGRFSSIVECRRRAGLKERCAQKFIESSYSGSFHSIVECRRRAETLKERCAQKFIEASQDDRFSSIVKCRKRAETLKERCAQEFMETSQDGRFGSIVANL